MFANYHTHTTRCHHALGSEREYIEAAIAGGMQVLGFSDHTPQPFPGTYRSGFRMDMTEAPDYFATLAALREEYADRIRILIGLECEYYPALFEELLCTVKPMGLDYLILGQHGLFNEQGAPMAPRPTEDPALLRQYVDQVIEGLQTGEYLYLAHPDIMNFVGDPAEYDRHMLRLCGYCKEHNVPLEINLLGLSEHRYYPSDRFFRLAAQVGNTAVIGCDAHKPQVLSDTALHAEGVAFAARYGLTLLDRLPV